MKSTKHFKKYSLHFLFEHTSNLFLKQILSIPSLDESIKLAIIEIYNAISRMANYMLTLRFEPVVSRKSSSKSKNQSQDMKAFLGTNQKQLKTPLNLADVIKFFKIVENFILKRKYLDHVDNLQLGHLTNDANIVFKNLPTLLLNLKDIDVVNKEFCLNYLFSIVTIYRQFKIKTQPDSSTITAPYSGLDINLIIQKFFSLEQIDQWLESLLVHWNNKKYKIQLNIYSGNASSPNSGSSSTKIMYDFWAVWGSDLFPAIKSLSKHFEGYYEFSKILEKLADLPDIRIIAKTARLGTIDAKMTHSRLFHFTAPGGKARMIANVDWISRTALSGIHFLLFSILKSVRSDFTFDHKKGVPHVMLGALHNPRDKHNFYSIDLSAATDRMPRLLQSIILNGLMTHLGYDGADIAKSWLKIVDRVYSTKDSPINNGIPVKYAVGQGMGLFTSWPIMSLMHHYIINSIVGVGRDSYALVGDDLLFYGTEEEYQLYIGFMKAIGLSVNENKTIQSYDSKSPTIEFARNFVVEGIALRPIPYGVVFAWNNNKVNFETLLWYFRDMLAHSMLFEFIKFFKPDLTDLEWNHLLYYLFKIGNNNEIFQNLKHFNDFKKNSRLNKKGVPHVMLGALHNPRDKHNFYSIDLSAATDRMPRLLQSIILNGLMTHLGYDGADIAKSWLKIVDRVYSTKDSPINNGIPVKYAVGQGMGLFTSWPIMSLMHHYIINSIVGVGRDSYASVGDDLLFYGTEEEYQLYIGFMKAIGLSVNENKTIQSYDSKSPTIEFARNFVVEGIALRPIPYGVVFAWNNNKVNFETLLWYFRDMLAHSMLFEFIKFFKPDLTDLEWNHLLYYLFKIGNNNEIFQNLKHFNDFKKIPDWIKPGTFQKVIEITRKAKSMSPLWYENNEFMSSFQSLCTLRKKEGKELLQAVIKHLEKLIVFNSGLLEDRDFVKICDQMIIRFENSNYITYDSDLTGGPLLSKRERRLLDEIHASIHEVDSLI